jgi:hypothetical protein
MCVVKNANKKEKTKKRKMKKKKEKECSGRGVEPGSRAKLHSPLIIQKRKKKLDSLNGGFHVGLNI